MRCINVVVLYINLYVINLRSVNHAFGVYIDTVILVSVKSLRASLSVERQDPVGFRHTT